METQKGLPSEGSNAEKSGPIQEGLKGIDAHFAGKETTGHGNPLPSTDVTDQSVPKETAELHPSTVEVHPQPFEPLEPLEPRKKLSYILEDLKRYKEIRNIAQDGKIALKDAWLYWDPVWDAELRNGDAETLQQLQEQVAYDRTDIAANIQLSGLKPDDPLVADFRESLSEEDWQDIEQKIYQGILDKATSHQGTDTDQKVVSSWVEHFEKQKAAGKFGARKPNLQPKVTDDQTNESSAQAEADAPLRSPEGQTSTELNDGNLADITVGATGEGRVIEELTSTLEATDGRGLASQGEYRQVERWNRTKEQLKNIEEAAIEVGKRIDKIQVFGLHLTDFFAGMAIGMTSRTLAKGALIATTGGVGYGGAMVAGGVAGAITGATREYIKQVRENIKEAQNTPELLQRKLKLKEKLRVRNKGNLAVATANGALMGTLGSFAGSYILEHGEEWVNYLRHIGENHSGGGVAEVASPTETSTASPTHTLTATHTPIPTASPVETATTPPTVLSTDTPPTHTPTPPATETPPPRTVTPPSEETSTRPSHLETVRQLFTTPDNPAAEAVGAHLDVSTNITNKVLEEAHIDPHSLSNEDYEGLRLAVQHKMEGWSNANFESVAGNSSPNESTEEILRVARNQLDSSWNRDEVVQWLKGGAVQELQQRTSAHNIIIEQINSHLTTGSFNDVPVNTSTNVGQLLAEHGHIPTWGAADADLLGSHVAANYDSLVNYWVQMAPENSHFPIALWDLDNVIRQARTGDPIALQRLKDALRWIPTGKTFRILSDAGIKTVLANDGLK